jgi:hypothetical protein
MAGQDRTGQDRIKPRKGKATAIHTKFWSNYKKRRINMETKTQMKG